MGVKVREKEPGSGVFWVFINHRGLRRSKMVGNKKLALEVAEKISARLTLGDFGVADKEKCPALFSVYAKTWIDTIVPATCKPSTLRDYEGILTNHILPVFGNLPVSEVNKLKVKEFLSDKINKSYAPSTVTHMKNAIGGILNLAVDDDAIPGNTAHRLGKGGIKARSLQLASDHLSSEELLLLLSAFKEHYPKHYPMALTLARTGMRLGEAIALQWGDIDFNGRFIVVQRGMSRGKIELPKNNKTRRVDMSKQLAETLLELKRQRKVEPIESGEVPDWVFVSKSGVTIDSSSWRKRIFGRALEKAGLRKIRIHDLRHTYAGLLIKNNESLAYIRDQLGHHSIKVTVDIYGHLAPGGNRSAVDRLDDAPIRTLSAPKRKRELTNVG